MKAGEVGDAFGLELLEVAGLGVGLSVFPAAEEDADPFEGQGADGGVVAVSASAEVVVEGFGPGAPLAGVVGELVERLAEELGPGKGAIPGYPLVLSEARCRERNISNKVLGQYPVSVARLRVGLVSASAASATLTSLPPLPLRGS